MNWLEIKLCDYWYTRIEIDWASSMNRLVEDHRCGRPATVRYTQDPEKWWGYRCDEHAAVLAGPEHVHQEPLP